jgi:RNA polymerase sigma-70 factor, ECF subfamily
LCSPPRSRGDERAFRQPVEPYRHALEVCCYRMLGSTQDGEDLVRETLWRAWRAVERFEPRAQRQMWRYRIATNACLDELERGRAGPSRSAPGSDTPLDEVAWPTYEPAARHATREGIRLALLHLVCRERLCRFAYRSPEAG